MRRGGLPRLVFALMTTRPGAPWLLDLFCGAGGAGMGYILAGYNVVGVDNKPQPRYPGWFIQGDALEFVREFGGMFDLIHASPPCQAHSGLRELEKAQGRSKTRVDLIPATRNILKRIGKPFVIENVLGAPLFTAVQLDGSMFNLGTIRRRLFESSHYLWQPTKTDWRAVKAREDYCIPVGMGGAWKAKNGSRQTRDWKTAMEIPWMERYELTQAVPPAYTEYIGAQLRSAVLDAAKGGD